MTQVAADAWRAYVIDAAGLVFGSASYAVDYTCINIGTVTWQSPVAGDTRQPRRRCLRQDRDGSAAAARMPVSLRPYR